MAAWSCPTAVSRTVRHGFHRRHGTRGRMLAAAVVASLTAGVARGDAGLPPEIVSGFTRAVQPLLINKCGQGACHGGPTSTAFRLRRLPGGRSPDRLTTLENLDAFLGLVGPSRDPTSLVHTLAVRHPASGGRQALSATPLTARERATLEDWLTAVLAAETPRSRHVADPAVIPATAIVPVPAPPRAPARPNRFQALLDAAAHPPEFPAPQQPQGVIRFDDPASAEVPPPPPPDDASDGP